jgi:hypothetical protein
MMDQFGIIVARPMGRIYEFFTNSHIEITIWLY